MSARLLAGAGILSGRTDCPQSACRPFDESRDGTVLAEAGAVLVLESDEHAGRRGACPRAELLSFATTTDGADLVAPSPDPAPRARSISLALERAGVAPGALDLVVAHGTATRANDPAEARALRLALGAAADAMPVVGLKGGLGHALGACTALEAAVVLAAMADHFLPGTVNVPRAGGRTGRPGASAGATTITCSAGPSWPRSRARRRSRSRRWVRA